MANQVARELRDHSAIHSAVESKTKEFDTASFLLAHVTSAPQAGPKRDSRDFKISLVAPITSGRYGQTFLGATPRGSGGCPGRSACAS